MYWGHPCIHNTDITIHTYTRIIPIYRDRCYLYIYSLVPLLYSHTRITAIYTERDHCYIYIPGITAIYTYRNTAIYIERDHSYIPIPGHCYIPLWGSLLYTHTRIAAINTYAEGLLLYTICTSIIAKYTYTSVPTIYTVHIYRGHWYAFFFFYWIS